jgi:hypothetical protein
MAIALAIASAIGGCGNTSAKPSSPPRTDQWGDPYVTEAQGRSIHLGESEAQAFRALGGRANSGKGRSVRETVQYPVRGTGSTENDEVNVPEAKEATWLEICLEGGRVVGVEQAKGGKLTEDCSGGKALPEPEG